MDIIINKLKIVRPRTKFSLADKYFHWQLSAKLMNLSAIRHHLRRNGTILQHLTLSYMNIANIGSALNAAKTNPLPLLLVLLSPGVQKDVYSICL